MKISTNKVKSIFFVVKIALILEAATAYSLETSQIQNEKETTKLQQEKEIIPDIDLRNYDVREKFYECYNPGYDADQLVCFNYFIYLFFYLFFILFFV